MATVVCLLGSLVSFKLTAGQEYAEQKMLTYTKAVFQGMYDATISCDGWAPEALLPSAMIPCVVRGYARDRAEEDAIERREGRVTNIMREVKIEMLCPSHSRVNNSKNENTCETLLSVELKKGRKPPKQLRDLRRET